MSHRIVSLGFIAVLGLAGMIVGLPHAIAADLDVPYGDAQEIPEQKVEFGSGWYIRGDIGATRMPSLNLGAVSLPADQSLIAPDPPTVTATTGSKVGYVASLGAGYQINNWIRSDIIADFHEPIKTTAVSGNGNVFCPTGVSYPYQTTSASGTTIYGKQVFATGNCTGNYQARLQSYDVLVNGYFDLGTWHRITPYVGAGVGLSFGHYSTSSTYVQSNGVPFHVTYNDPQYGTATANFDRSASGTYYNFAYALMGGVAIDVYDHTKLDIGYRYLNLGSIHSVSGDLVTQEVRAGLRYMIDN